MSGAVCGVRGLVVRRRLPTPCGEPVGQERLALLAAYALLPLHKACATTQMHASAAENINLSAFITSSRVGVRAIGGEVRSEGFNLTGQTELLTEVSLTNGERDKQALDK